MLQPFGNITALPAARWHPEPTFRGTSSILSSCLITMLLCVWTAVHLNVPAHNKEWQQFYRKIRCLILGLLAPELVVWNAWEQRKDVKRLSSTMREHGFMAETPELCPRIRRWFESLFTRVQILLLLNAGEADLETPMKEQPQRGRTHFWTEVHSWYAVMGGIAFEDLAPEEQQFMFGTRTRATLTTEGIHWLLENRPHLIPDISRQHIEDKSKSDGLAKLLTCWQTTYFCIQCIHRLSQKLSISLLELNVFAHALCALLLFAIWWDKPRDVHEPTLIVNEEGLDLCAGFLHSSWNHGSRRKYIFWLTWEAHEPCSDFREVESATSMTVYVRHDQPNNDNLLPEDSPDHSYRYLSFGPECYPCLKVLGTHWTLKLDVASLEKHDINGRIIELDNRCIHRLARAYNLVKTEGEHDPENPLAGDRSKNRCDPATPVIVAYINLFPDVKELLEAGMLTWYARTAAGVTLAGGLYGGLHLTAWASLFPSHVETILWRASSITTMVVGPLSFVYVWCRFLVYESSAAMIRELGWKRLGSWVNNVISTFEQGRLPSVGTALLVLRYIICRAFIVVECFIMLAHVPDTVLSTPTWTQYIPNIA